MSVFILSSSRLPSLLDNWLRPQLLCRERSRRWIKVDSRNGRQCQIRIGHFEILLCLVLLHPVLIVSSELEMVVLRSVVVVEVVDVGVIVVVVSDTAKHIKKYISI